MGAPHLHGLGHRREHALQFSTEFVQRRPPVVSEPNAEAIREHIIESLCWVRDAVRADVDRDIEAHDGNLRIDSKEGEAVCIVVEDALELGELVEAADLQPEELTSIASLTQLFEKRLINRRAAEGKDAA